MRSGRSVTDLKPATGRQPALRLSPVPQLHRGQRGHAEAGCLLGAAQDHLLQDRGRTFPAAELLRVLRRERVNASRQTKVKGRISKIFREKCESPSTRRSSPVRRNRFEASVVAFVVAQLQRYSLLARPWTLRASPTKRSSAATFVATAASFSRRAMPAVWPSRCLTPSPRRAPGPRVRHRWLPRSLR